MEPIARDLLNFDRFTLDLTRGSLNEAERQIDLRPKAFEVLRHLVQNAGRLVPKQELMEAAWPNVTVTDDSLVQCIRELREKLGDADHRLIKTVPRRGYLLEAARVDPPAATVESTDERVSVAIAAPAADAAVKPPAAAPRRAWPFALAACVVMLLAGGAGWLWHPWVAIGRAGVPPLSEFKDCAKCPIMVALPAGTFMMGSPAGEVGRTAPEGLPRQVRITKPFALGKFEITVEQFSAFVGETGASAHQDCVLVDADAYDPANIWGLHGGTFEQQPGYVVSSSYPVGCMSWADARNFVGWLSKKTGKHYRLPTEAEWEYAARAGTTTAYSFGNDAGELCAYARFADLSSQFGWRDGCRSEIANAGTLPVGSLKPNPWGLFDMHGNVWEWTADCWTSNPTEIPADGSARTHPGNCVRAVGRGGSWAAGSVRLRSAFRVGLIAAKHFQNNGFRVALTLGE